MSTVRLKPLLHFSDIQNPKLSRKSKKKLGFSSFNYPLHPIFSGPARFCKFSSRRLILPAIKSSLTDSASVEADTDASVLFKETFQLRRTQTVEGRVSVRLARGSDEKHWELTVGCNLPGKWILHWGVTYSDDNGNEWDQPPPEMRPAGSVAIKDYAIETPLCQSLTTLEGQLLHSVQINFNVDSSIAAINFVLKEEETGAWFQHRGRDFKILLSDCCDENTVVGAKDFGIWPGQISSILLNPEGSRSKAEENAGEARSRNLQNQLLEYSISKEVPVTNFLTVSIQSSVDTHKNLVHFDTDLPGEVVVHWGVSRLGDKKNWEIPDGPHPQGTKSFRKKALQTVLQPKRTGDGSWGSFSLDKEFAGLLFVLKINGYTWLNNKDNDFFVPLHGTQVHHADSQRTIAVARSTHASASEKIEEADSTSSHGAYTDGIIKDIRNLVSDISSEKSSKSKFEVSQERILQEIEKLAAEAYSIFRSSKPTFVAEPAIDVETLKPHVKIYPGTGSGFEILCQGFNWESHKSGRWYLELDDKAKELSSLGFTIIWLPPPTESVSPEGYMPRDLYNLSSRYGSMEQLKSLVNRLHEEGIKVLGDVVLNHRCAHYQNQNGVWNIFGGQMNWDDRAIVADDPHFQGRGNKSSGDNFHAAPNIDHSQDFVRKDIKEWLNWLRKEIGYDGWRLDFVRGFWGGYVKDYMDATEPYFAVGEYWDSLSYNYGSLDHCQDAHRQRIIDWINASTGTAGAFDVTTKGILHATLEKCEYWRLSDEKGKPPGVVGWWPSRAVTFIENHDTGSTQGHWRFPSGKEMQGYAYILTHPGTPAVFYDHVFSHYKDEIAKLISLRHRSMIHCRSTVKIIKADRDVYAANIDEKVEMKIGPGHYDPPGGPQKWIVAAEGRDYKVWEAS
ncbi:alpha-amylase 3, chloroplastic-like isoform X2 [Aristolochia californica]|uniref:alpha-amylase 3, chloroplastic-like isoform X2 n=1 Tax=Aristolochia californica TaxID=171875 RepID=UPI0035E3BB42